MLRFYILFLLLLPAFANAQETSPAARKPYTLLIFEGGITTIGVSGINDYAPERNWSMQATPWHVKRPATLIVRATHINAKGWGWGGRLELSKSSLYTYGDYRYYDHDRGLLDLYSTERQVCPVISLAPQVSKTFGSNHNFLTIAAYAGGTFGFTSKGAYRYGAPTRVTSEFLAGFQYGLDLSFRRQVTDHWNAVATVGFQHSVAQFQNMPFWLHFDNFPTTLGVGYQL
jgi:hypothetical protein